MKAYPRSAMVDLADVLPTPPASPFRRLRLLMAVAFAIVGVFLVGFGVWAVQAPLESAAIAGGVIEAKSSRKTIQHLEGGIVGRILVKDGDEVGAGQPLMRLDDTKARTTLQSLQGQLWDAQAREARLLAERDARSSIQFPLPLRQMARNNSSIAEILSGQTKIFDTRRKLHASRLEVITQRKAQTLREIEGLRFLQAAASKRASIIVEELAVITPLVEKGLQTRPRLLQLQREQAEIDGRRGDTLAQISRAEQAVGESDAQILKLGIGCPLRDRTKPSRQPEPDLSASRAHSGRERCARAYRGSRAGGRRRDRSAHSHHRGCRRGRRTAHGPCPAAGSPDRTGAGQARRHRPRSPGLMARIRLLPYKQRRVPPFDGHLIHVSADRLIDKATEQHYYLARIQIDEESLRQIPNVEIMPGMPVEVLIRTGEFTVARYALGPVLDSFRRAFREN